MRRGLASKTWKEHLQTHKYYQYRGQRVNYASNTTGGRELSSET